MKKISKVKQVQGAGTFEHSKGVDLGNGKLGFFKFEYTFEDGTVMVANHKSNQGFDIGSEVEYEVLRDNDFGKSGKVSKPQQGDYRPNQSFKSSKQSQASFALSYAKDIYCTYDVHDNPSDIIENVTAIADGLLEWLNNNQ